MSQFKLSKTRLLVVFTISLSFLIALPIDCSAQQIVQKQQLVKKPLVLIKRGDLSIKITQCPKPKIEAGSDLKSSFIVEGSSTFSGAVNSVVVDVFLTSKPTYPVPATNAIYSANYTDKVLLEGGRENISFNGPGTIHVKLNGFNTIPTDTPTGVYYLGVVIDAGNKVTEADENNNVAFCRLKIVGKEEKMKPDLTIPSLEFKKVKQSVDSQGNSYWLFNVIITVKNQGNGSSTPFKVLLERNVGAGGTYTTACATCLIDVPGLSAGQIFTLPPRQFNNANNTNSLFRASADSTNIISESNESNNMNAEAFH